MTKSPAINRIVILGDSLGMPSGVRSPGTSDSDAVEYEETYPYLLRQLIPGKEIISACKRSNRTDKQASQQCLYDDVIFYKPDAVVIHLGICDCAPRLFNRYESFLLSNLPSEPIRRLIIAFFKKYSVLFTKYLKKVFVKKERFESHLQKIVETVLEIKAVPIVVGIADTNPRNKANYFNYEKNIRDYNAVLARISEKYSLPYIDLFEAGDAILTSDGIHLNTSGAAMLADKIVNALNELERPATVPKAS